MRNKTTSPTRPRLLLRTPGIMQILRPWLLAAVLLGTTGVCRAGYNLWTNEYTFAQQDLQHAIDTRFPHTLRYM